MIKKLSKTDFLFIATLLIGILSLSIYLFTYPYLFDESFYATIPYRLANGDALVQHEWHLSQFSSLFSYLPVQLWLTLKGSSEGIIVFLRCIYFLIHTAATITIYKYFRKYKGWAIAAALLFFTQVAYRIFAISYNSMYVLFTLFFVLSLLSIYEKPTKYSYLFSGVCFGCCCICNPLYCIGFIFYLILCALWKKRDSFKNSVAKIKLNYISQKNKNIHKKQQKKKNKPIIVFPNMENYTCFFSKYAVINFFIGIVLVALVAVIFFFSTGGTLRSLVENIPNLLNSSEYNIFSNSLLSKYQNAYYYFNKISLDMPFMIPCLYLFLIFDKNRTKPSHKISYLAIAFTIGIIYMFGIFKTVHYKSCFFTLPFAVFSNVCYMLTSKKNKKLFYCMWLPSLIAALFQFVSANTLLSSLGIVFAINNIAGVFFVRDLFNETIFESKQNKKILQNKNVISLARYIMCIGLCAQLLFHGFILQYEQIPYGEEVIKANNGPYSGIVMTEQQYQTYSNNIADLDYIKSLNKENSPLLIAGYNNWFYMYADLPISTYTTWYNGTLQYNQLITYYKLNPDKIPAYIYIDPHDFSKNYDSEIAELSEIFEFKETKLSSGILLTVEKCKF